MSADVKCTELVPDAAKQAHYKLDQSLADPPELAS
jgi:hypothetical protein